MKILFIPVLSFLFLAGCSQESAKPLTKEEKAKELDVQIQELKNELITTQKKVIDSEMKSQERFRADFNGFAQEMEQVEKEEVSVKKLEQKLEALQKEKQELLQKN